MSTDIEMKSLAREPYPEPQKYPQLKNNSAIFNPQFKSHLEKLTIFLGIVLFSLLIVMFVYAEKVISVAGSESPGCPSYSCNEKSSECGYSAYFYDPQENNKKLCQQSYYYQD